MEEIIKRVAERFKTSEASARSKVMSKGAQMALTVLFEDSESIDAAALEEIERQRSHLNDQAEELAKKHVEYDRALKEIEKQKEEFEKQQKEFDELREQFEKAKTAEARDRLRLLEVYNSIISAKTNSIDFKTYVAGMTAMLSGVHLY